MKSLTPQDLIEFRLRRGAVEQAAAASLMMQLGFKAWGEELRKKYKVRGLFDIDIMSGQIVPRITEASKNGRSHSKRQSRRRSRS